MGENTSEIASLLSGFNTKISDFESRHELLREKVIILGNTFIKSRDSMKKEIMLIKEDLVRLRDTTDNIQENIRHILSQLEDFARKEQLQAFERYVKIWEPLKFMKEEEVQKMIDDALSSRNAGKSGNKDEE
ncbi:MAG: hypothetical protein V1886_00400 [archaeon]